MDNAPFDGGDNSVDEVCRILHHLAGKFDSKGAYGVPSDGLIRDINGNTIGGWSVHDEDDWKGSEGDRD